MSLYKVPYYQKAGLKWYVSFFYVFAFIVCALFAVSYFFVGIQQKPIEDTLFAMFFVAISLYLIYILGGLLLGKFYIELTEQGMNISVPFKKFSVNWEQISKVKLHRKYSKIHIAVLLKQDAGDYSFLIPLTYFMDADIDVLLNTFIRQVKKQKR